MATCNRLFVPICGCAATAVLPPMPLVIAKVGAFRNLTFSENTRKSGKGERPYRVQLPSRETMPRLLNLVRRCALPSHQMIAAAKGALEAPAEETVEILVYLAENNKIFGEMSRITLAGWDENSANAIAANPAPPKEVLDYWLSQKNLRPALFPLLLENPGVSLQRLGEIAHTLKGEWIDAMLANARIQKSTQLLKDLLSN